MTVTRTSLVAYESIKGGDLIVTLRITWTPNWFLRLCGRTATEQTARFVGSGTVWYYFPTFTRASIDMTRCLADHYARIQYEQLNGPVALKE